MAKVLAVFIGITLKSKSVKTRAYSLHTCKTLPRDLEKMRDHHKFAPDEQKHKEEIPQESKMIAAIG